MIHPCSLAAAGRRRSGLLPSCKNSTPSSRPASANGDGPTWYAWQICHVEVCWKQPFIITCPNAPFISPPADRTSCVWLTAPVRHDVSPAHPPRGRRQCVRRRVQCYGSGHPAGGAVAGRRAWHPWGREGRGGRGRGCAGGQARAVERALAAAAARGLGPTRPVHGHPQQAALRCQCRALQPTSRLGGARPGRLPAVRPRPEQHQAD